MKHLHPLSVFIILPLWTFSLRSSPSVSCPAWAYTNQKKFNGQSDGALRPSNTKYILYPH